MRALSKEKLPKMIILLLLAVLVVGSIFYEILTINAPSTIRANLSELYCAEEGSAAVVVNGKISNVRALYRNNKYYIRLGLLTDELNPCFYYQADSNKILYTSLKEVSEISFDETYKGVPVFFDITSEKVNDSLKVEEKYYVLLDYIAEYTNAEIASYKDPDRVFIWTKFGDVKMGKADGNIPVRTDPDERKRIVTELSSGTEFRISSSENGWSLIYIGEDYGYSGYVLDEDIKDVNVVSDMGPVDLPKYKPQTDGTPVCLAWHQNFDESGVNYISDTLDKASGITVVSPTWFSIIDSDGNISSRESSRYVEIVHNRGMKVWGMVENVNATNTIDYTNLFGKASSRENLVTALIQKSLEVGLDGINVDIEGLPTSAGKSYVQFIRELAIKCQENSLALSVDTYVPSPWTTHYHRDQLAEICDYLVVMSYDEHYSGSDAGSTSSLSFVQNGVENMLALGIDKSQIIMALPFYSMLWKGSSSSPDSSVMTMREMSDYFSNNSGSATWDEALGQYYIQTGSGDSLSRIWIEDSRSFEAKLNMLKTYDIAGIGCWKLGQETSDIWSTISNYFNK